MAGQPGTAARWPQIAQQDQGHPFVVLAALLALDRVKADDCACACFVEPVRAGATSAALIVGDAITGSFYPEVDALLDDTPPDAAECTAAEGGAGVVTTRRGSLTATTLLRPCASTC